MATVIADRDVCTGFHGKRSMFVVKNTIVTVMAGGNDCAIFYGENTAVIANTVDTIIVSRNVCTALNRKVVILRGVVVFAGAAVASVFDGVVDASSRIVVGSDVCVALNEEKAFCFCLIATACIVVDADIIVVCGDIGTAFNGSTGIITICKAKLAVAINNDGCTAFNVQNPAV